MKPEIKGQARKRTGASGSSFGAFAYAAGLVSGELPMLLLKIFRNLASFIQGIAFMSGGGRDDDSQEGWAWEK
jgi:hypothetical protein